MLRKSTFLLVLVFYFNNYPYIRNERFSYLIWKMSTLRIAWSWLVPSVADASSKHWHRNACSLHLTALRQLLRNKTKKLFLYWSRKDRISHIPFARKWGSFIYLTELECRFGRISIIYHYLWCPEVNWTWLSYPPPTTLTVPRKTLGFSVSC